MFGEQKMRERIEFALSLSRADQTEVVVIGETAQLTRFANSSIHQNVAKEDVDFRVRVVVGKKIGIATTDDLTDEALRDAVEAATTAARYQQDNPHFVSLPSPQPVPHVDGFVDATAACPPSKRAEAVKAICLPARNQGLVASGAFATTAYEYAVGNSLGVSAYYPTTLADLRIVIMSETSSGSVSYTHLTLPE